eukprot:2802730-Rhodomonas_salina.2
MEGGQGRARKNAMRVQGKAKRKQQLSSLSSLRVPPLPSFPPPQLLLSLPWFPLPPSLPTSSLAPPAACNSASPPLGQGIEGVHQRREGGFQGSKYLLAG